MTNDVQPPRCSGRRKEDALRRLAEDEDAWVATASPDGLPCMVPLSFVHHEGSLLFCTRRTNPTAVNLLAGGGEVTFGVGPTRDVVLVDAVAEAVEGAALTPAEGAAFVAKTRGWDPRADADWLFFRCRPHRVRAWREENELRGRLLMRDGTWRA